DVGPSMAADLRLVAHAPEGHSDELPAGRAGDRFADGGFPGPGRADQGEDGAGAPAVLHAALGAQLAYAEVFRDAPLHLLEALVVGVEHPAGLDGIEAVRGPLPPGHGEEPVEVGADHRGLRALLAHALQALELALGLRAHGLRNARVRD